MQIKYLVVAALLFMILFSASIPVYAFHMKKTKPTELERRLFEEIFDRLQEHDDLIETKIDDVEKSLSAPEKLFFSCKNVKDRAVESVSIKMSTEFVGFDYDVAERHEGTIGAVYVWDCRAVKDHDTLTIECTNMIMLNPTYMSKEETADGEERLVAMAENEMILYHEFLHGQLLMNVMKDVSDGQGWRNDACKYLANNDNTMDYSASDADHKVIAGIQQKYLAKLMEDNGGMLIVKTIDKQVGEKEFTKVMATFDELGKLAESGFMVFTRTTNLEGAQVLLPEKEKVVSLSATLQDPQKDGIVMMYILPKLGTANVRIELDVDEPVKSMGSEFVFTARVQNLQKTDAAGDVTLLMDGLMTGSEHLVVPAGRTSTVTFTWSSDDERPSIHYVKAECLNAASNEISVMIYNRLVSTTASDGLVAEQSVVDADGRKVTVARPERISATVAGNADTDVRLLAPDGTLVIGQGGLVEDAENKVRLVEVSGHKLVVKYTELNEKLRFFAVKSAKGGPLSEGEWHMDADDSSKIKYYASYVTT